MNIDITQEDLKEIKSNYDSLAKWLMNNFCSFSACALILETIISKVDELEVKLNQGEENE